MMRQGGDRLSSIAERLLVTLPDDANEEDLPQQEKIGEICSILEQLLQQQAQQDRDLQQITGFLASLEGGVPATPQDGAAKETTVSVDTQRHEPDEEKNMESVTSTEGWIGDQRHQQLQEEATQERIEAVPDRKETDSTGLGNETKPPGVEENVGKEEPIIEEKKDGTPKKGFGFEQAFAQSRKKREKRQHRRALRHGVVAIEKHSVDPGGGALKQEKKQDPMDEGDTNLPAPESKDLASNDTSKEQIAPSAKRVDLRDESIDDQQRQQVLDMYAAQLKWGKERGVIGASSGLASGGSPLSSPSSTSSAPVLLASIANGISPGVVREGESHCKSEPYQKPFSTISDERFVSVEKALEDISMRLSTFTETTPPTEMPSVLPAVAEIRTRITNVEAKTDELVEVFHKQLRDIKLQLASLSHPKDHHQIESKVDRTQPNQDAYLEGLRDLQGDVHIIKERLRHFRPGRIRYEPAYGQQPIHVQGHGHYYLYAALLALICVIVRILLWQL